MMRRREFELVLPEEVGISSAEIDRLLDTLQVHAEPHGLMMMRHGKIFFEGYWNPYAPGLRHGLQSHSKTYYATGIGVAITNGLIDLDERIVDIFPDDIPDNPSENLMALKVRHVLGMSAGIKDNPPKEGSWLRGLLALPVVYKPGTVFRYDSNLSNLLAYIFEKKMGYSLNRYMRENLYQKIGIDPDNLRCLKNVDGVDCAGGGLLATLEDNIRLMKLYLDGGMCDGQRILSEDYVKEATSALIDNTGFHGITEAGHDYTSGYGFQIWRCRHRNAYRADGHYGIYTIVCPDEDIVLSITETEYGKVLNQYKTLEAIWTFIDSIQGDTVLDPGDAAKWLSHRATRLALPRPQYAPYSSNQKMLDNVRWKVCQGRFSFDDTTTYMMLGRMAPAPSISEFRLHFMEGACEMELLEGEKKSSVIFAMDGTYHFGYREEPGRTFTKTCCYAAWVDDSTLKLVFRWLEGCYGTCTRLKLTPGGLDIICTDIGRINEAESEIIRAIRVE